MIKNIIFDFGRVLIDWNPRYLYRGLFDDEDKRTNFLTISALTNGMSNRMPEDPFH
jgi:FMN phosphatase YigB (HAD superfamily)